MAWSTSSTLTVDDITADEVWERAYVDASAWPRWNSALRSAEMQGPFAAGSTARIRFKSGLRLTFSLVDVDDRRVTDESRLPGASMGHRHAIDDVDGVAGR